MSTGDNDHLDEGQLLQAMVETADLPAAIDAHLSDCAVCRRRLEHDRRYLTAMGDMARRLAPPPPRNFSLGVHMARAPRGWVVRWRAVGGFALAGALVVGLLIGGPLWTRFNDTPLPRMASRPAWPSDPIMVEAGMLTENALPGIFLDLTGESDPNLDDEFIRFVVPFEDHSPLSGGLHKKGIRS